MATYWLVRHVNACITSDGVVWLDTKKDRYLGTTAEQFASLRAVLATADTNCQDLNKTSPRILERATEAAQTLLDRGILTLDSDRGKAFTQASIATPMRRLEQLDADSRPPLHFHHIRKFLLAHALALFMLRGRSLHAALRHVVERNSQLTPSPPLPPKRTIELVDIFSRIRIFFYSKREACLFDSLVLHEFLASHGVKTQVIIAVRTNPFKAHCWIQDGETVFNDSAAHCADFSVIFSS